MLQAAHHSVEIIEPRGDTRQFAVALEGVSGHVDRGRECLGEALKATVVSAGLGEFVQPPLGVLDLIAWGKIDWGVKGDVDHVLADLDQRAADRQVVDRMAVIFGIDDRRRFRSEPRQVLADRQATNIDVGVEERLERDRSGQFTGADQVTRELVNLLVNRLKEMRRLQKIRNPIEGLIVDQDSAKQRLFRLDIVRSGTVERSRFCDLLAGCRISEGHGCQCLPGNCGIARGSWRKRASLAVVPQFTRCIERWERMVFS